MNTKDFYVAVPGTSVIALNTILVNAYKLNRCVQSVFNPLTTNGPNI